MIPAINPVIVRLMQTADRLKFLVTSRTMLQLHEEHVIRLRGLDYPPENGQIELHNLLSYESVRFFLHWVQRRNPAFELSEHNAASIAELCRLNEGIPLALRLAAGWCELLSVEDLLLEIRKNVKVLENSLDDVPVKHRSIQALFDSIWVQMSSDEQEALGQLSIFRDGFAREAAAQVAEVTPLVLKSLLDKSLLVVEQGIDRRYHIHELLRLYASQRILKTPIWSNLVRRYIEYYANFIALRESYLHGEHQLKTLREIDREFVNIKNVWMMAVETGLIASLSKMLEGLFQFSRMRGYWLEGINLFQGASKTFEVREGDDARQLYNRLSARYFESNDDDLPRLLQLIQYAQIYGDQREVAYLTTMLGWQARSFSYHRLSLRYFRIALYQYRMLGSTFEAAEVLRGLALGEAARCNFGAAIYYNEESMRLRHQMGDQFGLSMNYVLLGELQLLHGDITGATENLLTAYDYIENYMSSNLALLHAKLLSWCYVFEGDLDQAYDLARQLANVADTPDTQGDRVFGLLILALMASLEGDASTSDRILQQSREILADPTVKTGMVAFTTNMRWLTTSMVALIACLNGHIDDSRTIAADLLAQDNIIRHTLVLDLLFTVEVICLSHELGDHLQADLIDSLNGKPWLTSYMERFQLSGH